MSEAIGYLRVSTQEQSRSGASSTGAVQTEVGARCRAPFRPHVQPSVGVTALRL
jgi:DNA invertase Pin-like site-specific DNA recombinase